MILVGCPVFAFFVNDVVVVVVVLVVDFYFRSMYLKSCRIISTDFLSFFLFPSPFLSFFSITHTLRIYGPEWAFIREWATNGENTVCHFSKSPEYGHVAYRIISISRPLSNKRPLCPINQVCVCVIEKKGIEKEREKERKRENRWKLFYNF